MRIFCKKEAQRFPGKFRWLMLALILLVQPLHAAEQSVMRFERITVADGLAQSSVMAIAQDQTGFMWFATENGIDRYDGVNFKHYRHSVGQPGTLANDFARDLHVASDGSIWIATDGGGLSRWDPETDRFTAYRHDPDDPNSLASDHIRTVLSDANGHIWIGTRGAGLDHLDPVSGKITHYTRDNGEPRSLSHNDIYALAIDDDGSVWVGTRKGLDRLDPLGHASQPYAVYNNAVGPLPDKRVRSLIIDSKGSLWVGTHRGGVLKFNLQTQQSEIFKHSSADPFSIASNRVRSIYQDRDDRIWFGTEQGLSLLLPDSERFLSFRMDPADPYSLSGDNVFSIYQDRGGVLWVGTLTGGANKWNPHSWSFGHFRPNTTVENGFTSINISSFAEDQSGNIWVGTFGGGINVVDQNNDTTRRWRQTPDEGLSDNRVMALVADKQGTVWAGTMGGGLNEIDPGSGDIVVHKNDPEEPNSLPANAIMSIHQDFDSDLWIGTFEGGVSRFNKKTRQFTNYELSSPRATSIAETPDGRIWVGTDGGGLNYYNKNSDVWQTLTHDPDDPDSLSASTIYDLHVDAEGRLWIGTRAGLDLLLPPDSTSGRYRAIGIKENFVRTAVYGIESDSTGTLWLSTNNGLVAFHPTTLDVRNFHVNQGLQGEDYNAGASFRGRDGTLYFGGSNGYNAFRPEEIQFNNTPPVVALTSISIMNEELVGDQPTELIRSLDLDYKDYVVTIGVAALDFAAPRKNRYAYRLVGLNEDWVNLGNERRITYTNLDGGNYTLQVKASNSDGVWNHNALSLPVKVAMPPWHTWWAYSLYGLAAVLLVVLLLRNQQQKLKREHEYSRRLEAEVHDRTKQLNARNKDLKNVNEKLLEASTTDPLTGLRNRRFLFEQIGSDVEAVMRDYKDAPDTLKPGGNNDLLFLMVDLDNFKPVNDTCGHEAGDELLLQIRDVLLEASRSNDDVIRWGGDEFLIVARGTNRKYAAMFADRIRRGLAQRVFPVGNGQVARITSSIGYASFPFIKEQPDLLSWEQVLGIADAAMYEAKLQRNAWTGIQGVRWYGNGRDLCTAIKQNPAQLAEEGFIRTIESIDDVAEESA